MVKKLVFLKKGQKQLQAIVNIPETKHKLFVNELFKDTVLILVVRVALDKKNNHYFPHPLSNTTERYMAVKIGLERKTYSLFNLDE